MNMEDLNGTTREQAERLMKCGVPSSSADKMWTGEPQTPAWSLGALLNLLPTHIMGFKQTKWYNPFSNDFELNEIPLGGNVLCGDLKLYCNEGRMWHVDYEWRGFEGSLPCAASITEAIVLAIELLAANGYDFSGNATSHVR